MEISCKNHVYKYKCIDYVKNPDTCKNCELAKGSILLALNENELDVIKDALDYLLNAELLPENGYTDEVIKVINSALDKITSSLD